MAPPCENETDGAVVDIGGTGMVKEQDNGEATEKADVESKSAKDGAGDDQPMNEDDDESEKEQIRRVMFETDNWEDCITECVWFG